MTNHGDDKVLHIGLREWFGIAVFLVLHGGGMLVGMWRLTLTYEKRMTATETNQKLIMKMAETNQKAIIKLIETNNK